MICLYIGDGKNVTACALGAGLSTAVNRKKVQFLSFIKEECMDTLMVEQIPNLEIRYVQTESCTSMNDLSTDAYKRLYGESAKMFLYAKVCAKNKTCEMLVLHRIAECLSCGLLSKKEVIAFLQDHGKNMEIILTGRIFPEEIMVVADQKFEITEI